jgi:hypothetical protein
MPIKGCTNISRYKGINGVIPFPSVECHSMPLRIIYITVNIIIINTDRNINEYIDLANIHGISTPRSVKII